MILTQVDVSGTPIRTRRAAPYTGRALGPPVPAAECMSWSPQPASVASFGLQHEQKHVSQYLWDLSEQQVADRRFFLQLIAVYHLFYFCQLFLELTT